MDYETKINLMDLYYKTCYYIAFDPEAPNINGLINLRDKLQTILNEELRIEAAQEI